MPSCDIRPPTPRAGRALPPRPRGGRRLRNRRGAMLAVVALLSVALVGMVAVVVDMGRFYLVVNDLQTTADASAMAGALALQRTSEDGETTALDSASSFVRRNPVLGDTIDPATGADASLVVWNPTMDEVVEANGVSVAVSMQGSYLLAGIFGGGPPTLSRSATAWVGNVSATRCLRPWVFPISSLVGLASDGARTAPPLLQAEVAHLRDLLVESELEALTMAFTPPDTSPPIGRRWAALDPPSDAAYPAGVSAPEACRSLVTVGDVLPVHDSDPNTVAVTSAAIAGTLCHFGGTDATCFSDATLLEAGREVQVAFATIFEGSATVDLIGRFVIACYVHATATSCSHPGHADILAPWGEKYPEGTIIGWIRPVLDIDLGGYEIGNTVSTSQRVLLVK